uniref:Uncharacterized protein n=1 Tax=Oryza barthii TaxID=65489 RepID=A0A0D3HNF2_9ORYZ
MPAVADPALLGGVQDGLVLVILAARGMGQTVQTRGANGGRRRAGRAARGEEGTAASARMRHASCRTGSGRAAARMARRGRSVTAGALQDASFGVWVHPPLLNRSVGRTWCACGSTEASHSNGAAAAALQASSRGMSSQANLRDVYS